MWTLVCTCLPPTPSRGRRMRSDKDKKETGEGQSPKQGRGPPDPINALWQQGDGCNDGESCCVHVRFRSRHFT